MGKVHWWCSNAMLICTVPTNHLVLRVLYCPGVHLGKAHVNVMCLNRSVCPLLYQLCTAHLYAAQMLESTTGKALCSPLCWRWHRILHRSSVPPLCTAQVLESTMGKAQLNMLYFVLLALTLLHWAACLYYYVAAWRDFDEWT